MTYDEALDATVTQREAHKEIDDHYADWTEFLEDEGDHETYKGSTILAWLGY